MKISIKCQASIIKYKKKQLVHLLNYNFRENDLENMN